MLPNSDTRQDDLPPIPSFQQPIPVPPLPPDQGEQICVQFGAQWLPYVLGSLQQLLEQTTWDVPTDAALTDAQMQANELIYLFQRGAPCALPGALHSMEVEDFMPLRVDCDCNVFVTCCDGTEIQLASLKDVYQAITNNPTGAPQPPAGGCATYHANMSAKDQFLVPTPIDTGDTILIENASGAVKDNQLPYVWNCPDGSQFIAGACLPFTSPAQASDPLSTAFHGQMVININGTYYALTPGSTFTVPGGVSNIQPTVQANLQLSTAEGSFQYDVKVCKAGSSTWTRTINFLISDGGFSNWTGSTQSGPGSWVSGVGWESADHTNVSGAHFQSINLQRLLPSFHLTSISLTFTLTKGTSDHDSSGLLSGNGPNPSSISFGINVPLSVMSNGAGQVVTSGVISLTGTYLVVYLNAAERDSAVTGGSMTLTSMTITGDGPAPF